MLIKLFNYLCWWVHKQLRQPVQCYEEASLSINFCNKGAVSQGNSCINIWHQMTYWQQQKYRTGTKEFNIYINIFNIFLVIIVFPVSCFFCPDCFKFLFGFPPCCSAFILVPTLSHQTLSDAFPLLQWKSKCPSGQWNKGESWERKMFLSFISLYPSLIESVFFSLLQFLFLILKLTNSKAEITRSTGWYWFAPLKVRVKSSAQVIYLAPAFPCWSQKFDSLTLFLHQKMILI